MSDEINRDRRHLVGTAAVTVASAQLGVIAFTARATATSLTPKKSPASTNTEPLMVGWGTIYRRKPRKRLRRRSSMSLPPE